MSPKIVRACPVQSTETGRVSRMRRCSHTQSPIMPDRAGYQVSLYAIDVSASMGEIIDDPTGISSSTSKKTKLDYVKEFIARKCEPKVCI
jgi:hypothetical protein